MIDERKWQAIEEEELNSIREVSKDYFPRDTSYCQRKHFANNEDAYLEVSICSTYELDYNYDSNLISIVKDIEKVMGRLEEEGYFNIKLTLEEERDYAQWFQLNMYRKQTQEEKDEQD